MNLSGHRGDITTPSHCHHSYTRHNSFQTLSTSSVTVPYVSPEGENSLVSQREKETELHQSFDPQA